MFTDMVGYSALTQKNESLAIDLLQEHRKLLRPLFSKHGGQEVETVGDAFFVEFNSALEAVNCAVEIQTTLFERNAKSEPEKRILLRIGLHIGDVIHVDNHVHGDGVNIAARLEPLSTPGGICLSEDVARQIQNKIELPLIKIQTEKLKNIKSPVEVYHLILPWEDPEKSQPKSPIKKISKQQIIFSLAAAVILIMAILYFWNQSENGPPSVGKKRIAVLPLVNISENSQDEYFVEGMTEELISQLAKMSDLNVIARTSVMKYKNAEFDIEEIGEALGVGTILQGSVRKSSEKARIAVQLIDIKTQEYLWAEDYDSEIKDIFAVQSDIALRIANELKVQLVTTEKQQIEKTGTQNADAYRKYLLGRFYLNKRTEESILRSLEYFNYARESDPKYALAYVGIADCYTLIGGAGYGSLPVEEAISLAKEAAKKALELDKNLAEAYDAKAYINFRLEWNWDEAEKNFRKAIALRPGYAAAYERYAFCLALLGRFEEALSFMHRAQALDPLSPSVATGIGRIYHFSHQYDKAIEQFNKILELEPGYVEAIFSLGLSYTQKGLYEKAISKLKKAAQLSNNRPIIIASIGYLYALSGNRDEAIKILNILNSRDDKGAQSPLYSAVVNCGLGNKEQALDSLHKSFDEHFGLLVYSKVTPFFDNLRSEPRFVELLKKIGFEG
jgi:TolB-like protein/Flp pilus assembly protein TadD